MGVSLRTSNRSPSNRLLLRFDQFVGDSLMNDETELLVGS